MIKKITLTLFIGFTSLYSSEALQDSMIHKLLVKSTETKNEIKALNDKVSLLENKLLIMQSNTNENKNINLLENRELSNDEGFKSYIVMPWILNIRSKPTTKSKKIDSLKIGKVVKVYDISNGWAKIDKGYVSALYLKMTNNSSFLNAYINNNNVAARAYPARDKKIVERFSKGKLLKLSSELFNKSWYKIKGKSEFIHNSDIQIVFR